MSYQDHHMATYYGAWGQRFTDIVESYGLTVEDTSHVWNVHYMRHAGGHPWNYHNWVWRNTLLADETAQTYPEGLRQAVFISLFNAWVVDVVKADPTIVRAAYWKCQPDYRWR